MLIAARIIAILLILSVVCRLGGNGFGLTLISPWDLKMWPSHRYTDDPGNNGNDISS